MPVWFAYLLVLAIFVVSIISLWFNHRNKFVFSFTTFIIAVILVFWSDSPYIYRIGPYEYVVRGDSIITAAESREIRFTKPEGEIRSYRLIDKEVRWNPPLQGVSEKKIIMVAKGSPEHSEQYFALIDSIANPFEYIQSKIRNEPHYYDMREETKKFSPAIEPAGVKFPDAESRILTY